MIIYIDGQNFLYKVAERLANANLISDKQEICSLDIRWLLEKYFPNEELKIRYYGVKKIYHSKGLSEEMELKASRFSDNLRRFRNYLNKDGVTYMPKGSLKARMTEPCKRCGHVDYKFQEKGVDVGIAIDLVSDVLSYGVSNIALLSSDTDLLPALQVIKNKKVRITYVSFSEQTTISLAKIADSHVIFDDKDILESYIKSVN